GMGDDLAGVLFQRAAESIVGGEEKPGVTARLHQRAAGADRERAGVEGPMEAIGRAGAAGDGRGRIAFDTVVVIRHSFHLACGAYYLIHVRSERELFRLHRVSASPQLTPPRPPPSGSACTRSCLPRGCAPPCRRSA